MNAIIKCFKKLVLRAAIYNTQIHLHDMNRVMGSGWLRREYAAQLQKYCHEYRMLVEA